MIPFWKIQPQIAMIFRAIIMVDSYFDNCYSISTYTGNSYYIIIIITYMYTNLHTMYVLTFLY